MVTSLALNKINKGRIGPEPSKINFLPSEKTQRQKNGQQQFFDSFEQSYVSVNGFNISLKIIHVCGLRFYDCGLASLMTFEDLATH